ncbi:MAG: DUF305 domain-containing protein [Vicinamibacterales bacterium]
MKRVVLAAVLTAPVFTSCRSAPPQQSAPIVQPGSPGEITQVLTTEKAEAMQRPGVSPADVKFMQGMIGHHSQAVDMVELLKTRTADRGLHQLGERIEVSQRDEIKLMEAWLRDRGQEVPGPHAMHLQGAMLMPGMLSAEEMAQLAAAKAGEFDRLFLTGMIKHHGGALSMVQELFASPGAANDTDIYAFASDVEADQRMEINRMSGMLKERQK